MIRAKEEDMKATKEVSEVSKEDRSVTRLILDSIADGVFTVDQQGKITSFNRAAERITGFSRKEAIGQFCNEIFRANICFDVCPLKYTARTSESIINMEVDILNQQNQEIPISISTAILKNPKGEIVGAVETFRDLSPIVQLRKEISKQYTFQDIVSRSKAIAKLLRILPDIAESDATILIQGESGTGKELFATAIHNLSPRKGGPLIKVNCGALPETLLESELFGYKKGAFTDAKRDKPGRFKLAEGGTLFLDEIGDLSKGTQVKLLRVLEQKEFEPLGSTRTEKADVRIVVATHHNLATLVDRGAFRGDLFYRLNVMKLEIPPLRERMEDVPLLVDHFIVKLNMKTGKQIRTVSKGAIKILLDHDYPGSVRELENIIEHAFILCKGIEIKVSHLPQYLLSSAGREIKKESVGIKRLYELEKRVILEVLERNRGDMGRTARDMGVHRSTILRKIKNYGVKVP
jgi:PAS domain S-box-containing protein